MNLKNTIITVLVLITINTFGQGDILKRITILESNNLNLNYNYEKLPLPDSINTLEYTELKEYVLSKTSIKSKGEPELYFELMQWVSNQWKHNGWNAAPDSLNSLGILKSVHNDGQRYRCVEYGVVLNDILNSFGYVARTVGLKHIDVDYGGAGMGHVATEVWSNKLNKWIFLDPQFGVYAQKDDVLLNIYEIYQFKKGGDFNKINFVNIENGKYDPAYGDEFLTRYLAYIEISQNNKGRRYALVLKMEGNREYLAFQAFPSSNDTFTSNVEDVYYSLNKTLVIFDYHEDEKNRTQEEFSKLSINSPEDFVSNMSKFAARPNFVLSFENNMPWFSEYKVKLNDSIIEAQNGKYFVNLDEGISTLTVVAVNENGTVGIPTVIRLKYE